MDIRKALEVVGDNADIAVVNVVFEGDNVYTIVKGNGVNTLGLIASTINTMAKDKCVSPKLLMMILEKLVDLEEDNDETFSDDSESEGGSPY